jgi:hypothetical protein
MTVGFSQMVKDTPLFFFTFPAGIISAVQTALQEAGTWGSESPYSESARLESRQGPQPTFEKERTDYSIAETIKTYSLLTF